MIYSMTGYASQEQALPYGTVVLELRSVNHRYLELHFKLDDTLRHLEPMVREMLQAKLGRGKVECRLSWAKAAAETDKWALDTGVVNRLSTVCDALRQQFPDSAPMSINELLRWPGVLLGDALVSQEAQQEQIVEAVKQSLEAALSAMVALRGREGDKLKAMLLERLVEIERVVAQVRAIFPAQVQAYQARLMAKLQEAVHMVDNDRVQQEMVIFAQRVDVDEELSRLVTHVSEVRHTLEKGGLVGKRLDFLMQELNREANTLGSKAISTEVSQASMSLKLLIEQMREQIQNIE